MRPELRQKKSALSAKAEAAFKKAYEDHKLHVVGELGEQAPTIEEYAADLAETAKSDPELAFRDMEKYAPGLRQGLEAVNEAERRDRENATVGTRHYLRRLQSIDPSSIDPNAAARVIEAAMDADDPREAAKAGMRQFLAQSDPDGFIDACDNGELSQDDLDRALASEAGQTYYGRPAPADPDPLAGMSDADLDAALAAEARKAGYEED